MAYTTIDDPSAHFQTVIWTGNDSNPRTILHDGNSDMQPDWLWHKLRSGILSHMTYDSTRGVTKRLHIDQSEAEATQSDTGTVTAFTSDGFTVNAGTTNDLYVNDGSRTYVSWGWKANGGTTASNSNGSITSTVQANTDAGFSIVTYTGTGSNATVGHGLGAVPDMVIVKNRTASDNWGVQLANALGNTNALRLNNTDAYSGSNGALWWNDTSPTSTTISIGTRNEVNQNTKNYVMYCFKNIQGYSKIGKYIGNGNANGTFVYTGFEPAWIMVKLSSADGNSWQIVDNKRNPLNTGNGKRIFPNNTNAESSSDSEGFDFLSNGFKLRNSSGGGNTNAATYIYMAFAEHPFVSSEGVPTTAR